MRVRFLVVQPCILAPAPNRLAAALQSQISKELRLNNSTIAVIRGDGIGPEIMDATLHVLDSYNAGLSYDFVEAGVAAYEKIG